MYKGKPVQYRGFTIRKDHSDRYVVLAPSVVDGEPTEINDRLQTLGLAKDWIDETQFDAADPKLDEARALVGQKNSAAGLGFYVNERSPTGSLTGEIYEFSSEDAAIAFILNHNYV